MQSDLESGMHDLDATMHSARIAPELQLREVAFTCTQLRVKSSPKAVSFW